MDLYLKLVLFGMINESEVPAIWKYRALTVLTKQGREIYPFEVFIFIINFRISLNTKLYYISNADDHLDNFKILN